VRIFGSALLLALFLSGCALPPAVTVASFVADGVSYVATGKSTTDHAISAVVGEDCALLRTVQDKAICDPDGDVLVELVRTDPSEEDWTDHGDFHLQDNGTITVYGSAKEIEAARLPL
jgi:hypothetical protein